MKKSKKIMALSLALALVFSSMGNVFAYQLGDDVYSGIQVDDTFYSARYITDNKTAFGNVFGHANSNNVILDFNGNAARFSDYLAANPADFDTWAAAHKTPANPGKLVKPDGTIVTIGAPAELTVKSAVAVNGTTIDVVFSDNSTARIEGLQLVAGTHDVPFTYNSKSYVAKNVTYTPPVPTTASVEKIEFVNYRNIKVTFNTEVDEESATDASNYYFEIVDGNAHYGAVPTLQESNQLSKITTEYLGGADDWWNGVYDAKGKELAPPHILARTLGGKTVVSICLPEDARFTTIKDNESGSYPDPYLDGLDFNEDAERTLAIKQRTSKTSEETIKKLLIKNTVVNVAVRNIKDTNGKLSIDTAVMPITILDEVRPQLLGVDIADNPIEEARYAALGKNLGTFDLLRSDKQMGEKLEFVYSEPVFDGHGYDKSDLEFYRNIELYVEGKKIASLYDENLNDYMKFEMDTDSTYMGSRIVSLDVEKAVKDACHEVVATETMYYDIMFVGVTDLAGNLEEASEHYFRVKFHDDPVEEEELVYPNVENVVQVADNMFRVEFNREDAEGEFVIFNPDGDGVGELKVRVPRSKLSADGVHYYSYVAVPARDHEPCEAIPTGHLQSDVLAYDGADEIYRNYRVQNIFVDEEYDLISDKDLPGNDYIPTSAMTMVDDILAPKALEPEVIGYANRGNTIEIPVIDMIPWVNADGSRKDIDIDYEYEVFPIAYRYDDTNWEFKNEIRREQIGSDTYLPVKVSYVDNNGATHEALISNYDLRPWDYDGTEPSDLNPGYNDNAGDGRDAIRYDFSNDILTLDLSFYPELLVDGKLAAGKTYKVEIPKGYFSDAAKDTHFVHMHQIPVPVLTAETSECSCKTDWGFGGNRYDILAVDDGRDDTTRCDSGLGYTSDKQLHDVEVRVAPTPDPDPEYVPQTSKQLINYEQPTNTMRIEFTGTIDVATLLDKNNYSFNGKTLAQWDAQLGTNTEIVYHVDYERQFAVFEIPQDSIMEDGDYSFKVEGVSHPNGGTMTPVTTVVGLRDNFRPVVEDAVTTTDSQIKLTFNEPIRYFVDTEVIDAHSTAKNFIVMVGGVQWQIDTAVLPTGHDNDREIILNGTKMPATGNITVQIVKDQNNNILVVDYSDNRNPMKETTYNVRRANQ